MNEFLIFIALFALSLWLLFKENVVENYSTNIMQGQFKRLWQDAYQNLVQNNVGRAERSLLALLKLDGRNVAAYNRLGIIYARQGLKKEAIECFEMSSSINPSAGSLHNLALVYFGNKQYQKAARVFEQAITREPNNPTRRIALAKVLEKMDDPKGAIKELEKAHKMSPGGPGSNMLIEAYKRVDAPDLASQVENEAKQLKQISAS